MQCLHCLKIKGVVKIMKSVDLRKHIQTSHKHVFDKFGGKDSFKVIKERDGKLTGDKGALKNHIYKPKLQDK